jgi:APA family basic amino acid/polyamine antiporter/amino acid efflux transporter
MKLKRTIGKKTLLFLSINAMIGTEIFFVPAIAASIAGTASIISWIIMSIIAILISLYFAELVSLFPKAGGVYEYTKQAFGEFPSFMVGWSAWIVASVSIAMFIIGSLRYLFPSSSILFYMISSLLLIALFNYINYRGIGISSKLLFFFGVITVVSLLILILPGIPLAKFSFAFSSFPAIFLAMYFISEAFFGWDGVTYLSEEVKDARRIIPRFLVITTIISVILSIAVVFVSLGLADWRTFSQEKAPLVFIASKIFGSDLGKIFSIFVFIPIIGTAVTWIISSPRLLFAMSRDRVLVPRFRRIHKKYRTPHNAILFQAVITSIITILALGNYEMLLSLSVPLCIIVYTPVLLSVARLRKLKMERFKAPFARAGPIIIILFLFMLLGIWLIQTANALSILSLALLLVFIGIPFYILIKLQTDKKFIEKFFDKISWFQDIAFPVWYGEKELRKVLSRIKIKKGAILDFGCGSGFTTLELAKRFKDSGRIVAVDLSKVQLEKASDKIEKAMKISNVIFIKSHQLKFEPKSFDAITAVCVLEHLDKPEKVLKEIFRFLKPGGYFSFLSFGKSFGIPGSGSLGSRDKIELLFRRIRLEVNIRREKKRFAEYWYIWGRKPKGWR